MLPGFREAAVLLPLLAGPGEEDPHLLFTVRQADLPTHAGQIAFPGGKRDAADRSPEETALREAQEELGLDGDIEVLGLLDDVPTPAGFIITPVVGVLPRQVELRPNRGEVAEVFSAPLSALRRVHQAGPAREFLGVHYVMHEYPYRGWRIWGATAYMVQQLLGLLDAEGAQQS
ncbi:MAG: CoA pyrophosphatase [Myxococcales bacterium]|nr:CoA pyrophosphatase [Myxococcota bacterium]MDW8281500.1 CoA pyrophosphatase [Myxococcales bacterium]